MYKSNDILRKQTALKVLCYFRCLILVLIICAYLKYSRVFEMLIVEEYMQGERKLSVLAFYSVIFTLHVIGIYWWYQNDDLCYPLFMVPPKAIPPFWNAIFTIIVNGTFTLYFTSLTCDKVLVWCTQYILHLSSILSVAK